MSLVREIAWIKKHLNISKHEKTGGDGPLLLQLHGFMQCQCHGMPLTSMAAIKSDICQLGNSNVKTTQT